MRVRLRDVPIGLAFLQLADAAGNALIPRRVVDSHLDHLRVPVALRPALPVIKVLSSVGLVIGTQRPRLGVVTSTALIGYYAAAVGFHVHAGDPRIAAAPAAIFGAAAFTSLVGSYLPAVRGS